MLSPLRQAENICFDVQLYLNSDKELRQRTIVWVEISYRNLSVSTNKISHLVPILTKQREIQLITSPSVRFINA